MSEAAFDRWWGEDKEPDFEGVRAAAMDAWEAAVEACAAEAEAARCACLDMGSAEDEELGPDEHYSRCPLALAVRLRGLA